MSQKPIVLDTNLIRGNIMSKKPVFLLLCTLLFCNILCSTAISGDSNEDTFIESCMDGNKEACKEAIKSIKAILSSDPAQASGTSQFELYSALGLVYGRLADWDNQIKAYTNLLDMPENKYLGMTYYLISKAYLNQGETTMWSYFFKKALQNKDELLEKHLRKDPSLLNAYKQLSSPGCIKGNKEACRQAIKYEKEALAGDTLHEDEVLSAYDILAKSYEVLEDWDNQIKSYSAILDRPDNDYVGIACYHLAKTYLYQKKDYDTAITYCNKALNCKDDQQLVPYLSELEKIRKKAIEEKDLAERKEL
jgi:tetratricopeptide (TPR) repeat protein